MTRLHLQYREEAFDRRIIELTKRFISLNPWHRKADHNRLFDAWLHGANIVYGLPEVLLTQQPTESGVGMYNPAEDGAGWPIITLHKWSLVSLFHQYRHHMQANSQTTPYADEAEQATDAQAWACSLFYVCDPKRFRRMVRLGRIAGVHPKDLLKKRKTK